MKTKTNPAERKTTVSNSVPPINNPKRTATLSPTISPIIGARPPGVSRRSLNLRLSERLEPETSAEGRRDGPAGNELVGLVFTFSRLVEIHHHGSPKFGIQGRLFLVMLF